MDKALAKIDKSRVLAILELLPGDIKIAVGPYFPLEKMHERKS